METYFRECKLFMSDIEQYLQDESKYFDVEHLTGPQGYVLKYLMTHSNKDISFTEIEAYLKVSKSVTSNLIKRMVKNGFVIVESGRSDKRMKYIRLTDYGRSKAKNLKAFVDHISCIFLRGTTQEERDVARHVTASIK